MTSVRSDVLLGTAMFSKLRRGWNSGHGWRRRCRHMAVAALMLPLVECLPPVVTKSFGRTSQCEWAEEGFLRWDPSSGVASRPCERSHSEPPGTQTGPWWVARAPTGRRSRQVPGISQLPAEGSKHTTQGRHD